MNNRSDFDKNENNIPPDGGLIEYHEPHSPFQKLIDSERKRHGLSGRELAEKIGVSQSTLWIWLHNVNGYPHPKSFNSEHVRRLAEVLTIPESKIEAALEASRHLSTSRESSMPHETFDAFRQFICILENEKRETVSKSYVLNLAKNLYRSAKVTLLIGLLTASAAFADPQTFVTTSGKRYENVRVIEITPTTIAFMHATGAARLLFTDFGPDVQRKYGYDEAKAKAWLAEQTRQAAEAAKAEQAQREQAAKQGTEVRRRVQAVVEYLDDGGHLVVDPHTGLLYDPDAEAARRAAAFKAIQQHGTINARPTSASH